MYRRGQASAVGAVFLTLIVILLVALIARQIQVQTEVQKIASEVANQRSGEGELSLTLNYIFLSFSPGNVSDGTRSCIPSLTSASCIFTSSNDNGKYMLILYFSAINVPKYFYNVTSNLYLSSDETVEATLYENNRSTLIARGTYTLPANSSIVITSHFVNYTIIFSSTSPFRISIDFLNYTFQAYNSTGFYAKITNIGPSPTRLYGLWLLNSTYARRINTSTWLEPGASQTFSVNLPVSSISEIRAITTTRVNIFRISVKPPTPIAAPGPGGGGAYSKFMITSYNQTIAGPVSSKQLFVATVQNTGNASGTVAIQVWDSNGNLVNSGQAIIPAGGSATMSLYVTLPSSRGTYTWTAKAINTATGATDDSKSILVIAKDIYLQSRGALFYTPFEFLPSGWSSIGGSWFIAPGYGVSGTSALKGTDDNGGPGDTSVYYWQSSVSSYASLYALVQLTNVNSGDQVYRGFVLLEDTSKPFKLYEVALHPEGGNVLLYIQRFVGNWQTGSSATAPYSGNIYMIFLSLSGSGRQNMISAILYDQGGSILCNTSDTYSSVSPNYFGLVVDGGAGYFDNLVIASTADPRYVWITGLTSDWTAELRDSSGNLVSYAVADSSGTATLSVVKLPVILNGSIVIKDQYGNVVIRKTFSDIVGGDTYTYG